MLSIDQNSHSLWDVPPKLHALLAAGHHVQHCIEGVDVAFTTLGSQVEESSPLRLERERYHHSGGADWGAALFYTEFLGRAAVDLHQWEPLLGMKLKALAKELETSVEQLFDEFSPSDNWQLIGPSYVGDREHHRVIDDITAKQAGPFVLELLSRARADVLKTFPQKACQDRTNEWFDSQTQMISRVLDQGGVERLVDVYQHWLRADVESERLQLCHTAELFNCRKRVGHELLELFLRDYGTAGALYNQALEETGVSLRPLRLSQGELPLFVTMLHKGHVVRCGAEFRDGKLIIADMDFAVRDARLPIEQLCEAGIKSLAGKAVLLVMQVRLGTSGQPLALPYRGSVYMPAAYRLERLLEEAGLMPGGMQPVYRVRLRFLDHLRGLDSVIHLPPYLRRALGREEITADELARNWRDIQSQALQRLSAMPDAEYRQNWQKNAFPDLHVQITQLEERRRQLAQTDPKGAEIRELWKQIKSRQQQMLRGLLEQIDIDWQLRDLDYWDSRGALLPWAVAAGGQELYNRMIKEASIYVDNGADAAAPSAVMDRSADQ